MRFERYLIWISDYIESLHHEIDELRIKVKELEDRWEIERYCEPSIDDLKRWGEDVHN